MTTKTKLFWIAAVCAAPSTWCVAGIGAEPLQPSSSQATSVDAQQLAAAATGVRQIVAHRGSSADRPENTLASTLRAIAAGATAVEVDVRTTRDGRLVLSHDAALDRTTDGTGKIGEATLAEIRRLDAGSWFDKRYAAERVPTLDEVLVACRGEIDVLLDLKEAGDEYARRVTGVVKKHGEPSRTIVGVRSVEQAELFRRLLPQARQIGLIATPDEIESYAAAGVEMIRLWPKWLTDGSLVKRVRKAGLLLHLNGTVGTSEELAVLLKHCPDSISGDDPARIVATLTKLKKRNSVVPFERPGARTGLPRPRCGAWRKRGAALPLSGRTDRPPRGGGASATPKSPGFSCGFWSPWSMVDMRTPSVYTPRPQPRTEFSTGFKEDREMLVLSRKAEQTIVINGEITVRIIAVRGNVVRIGIEAPQEVPIHRGELLVPLPETNRQLCPA